MISFVKGTVAYKENGTLIIDNHGIGYQISVPVPVYDEATAGEEILLYTYLSVREDGLSLYGVSTRKELDIFLKLLGISQIGPKAALAVLSTLTVEELVLAVFSEDVKTITKTPGIGPKGAKRLIMELKDKLDLESYVPEGMTGQDAPVESFTKQTSHEMTDAILALEALGYSTAQAKRAVHSVPEADRMDSGLILKEALKYIR